MPPTKLPNDADLTAKHIDVLENSDEVIKFFATTLGYNVDEAMELGRAAVNMDTGDIAYRKTLGVTDAFPPQLQNTGRPSTGGPILTASGLTFVGGTDDFRFRAFATATGQQL